MRRKERKRQSIDPECDASRMRNFACLVDKAPCLAKMFAVVVEAHAGGRTAIGANGYEELELQCLLDLVRRHELPDAAKEPKIRDGLLDDPVVRG